VAHKNFDAVVVSTSPSGFLCASVVKRLETTKAPQGRLCFDEAGGKSY